MTTCNQCIIIYSKWSLSGPLESAYALTVTINSHRPPTPIPTTISVYICTPAQKVKRPDVRPTPLLSEVFTQNERWRRSGLAATTECRENDCTACKTSNYSARSDLADIKQWIIDCHTPPSPPLQKGRETQRPLEKGKVSSASGHSPARGGQTMKSG